MNILWVFLVALFAFGKGRRVLPWLVAAIFLHGWLLVLLIALRQKPIRFDPTRLALFFQRRDIAKELKSINTPADIPASQ